MDFAELEKMLRQRNEPKFRFRQILKAVFQDGFDSFLKIKELPKDLAQALEGEIGILPFQLERMSQSKDSFKALLKLEDGNLIETVLISPKPGNWSACISCQVGCAMGCKFCATGQMGFKRNLTPEEIYSQVLFWQQYLKNSQFAIRNLKLTNIVYMGMGEPFLNWDNVSESLKVLIDKKLFGFGARSISISTVGICEGIEKLAKEFPQVNLAISLHFADNEKRNEFMPANRKRNVFDLKKSIQNYFTITNRKVFIEYLMLDGINDSKKDAESLVKFIKSIENYHLLHVNLIRYNSTSKILKSSSEKVIQDFKKYLEENGVNVTIRKSLGKEIGAACGQLAGISDLTKS